MKICYIADGSSIHTQRWVNYFAAKGHETHLIYWKTRPGYHQDVHIHYLKRFAPAVWPVTRYFSFLQWIFRVRKLLKEIRPDVIDAHFIIDNGLLAALSGFHPYVVTAWGSDVLLFPRRNFIWRLVAKFVIKRADRVVCDSEVVKKGLLWLGSQPEKISIIYNGIDTDKFSPQRADDGLKDKLGISGFPTIICIRHLRPLYNVEMLVRAIPLVLKQVTQARFIIGGDGFQRDYLENLVKNSRASQNVRFIGYLPHDDLAAYLASADIYVSTSRSDSTSLSLQEAMACGLAPVVTDLPANREWITDGENGFVVPQEDYQALAEKIVYLLNNGEVRAKFGKINRKLIKDRAEYEKEMAKDEQLYADMMYG
ncbi:MAG: glycosyltransferase family 4 protein [Dehalococcoidales bacterium]|nr:glycosyltransferase family 4 protein [Dehalococcoidales bacterium]